MRYRAKSYVAAVTQVGTEPDTLTITINVDGYSYSKLPAANAGLADFVIESVRLVANETLAGYILASTGQKSTITEVSKNASVGADPIYTLTIKFTKAALTTVAGTDVADLAAIEALFSQTGTLSDQFTIALDFGISPEEMKQDLENIWNYLAGQEEEQIPGGLGEKIDYLLRFWELPAGLPEFAPMPEQEVTGTLEDIMQAIDPALSQIVEYPEGSGTYMTKAQVITAQTNEIIHPNS